MQNWVLNEVDDFSIVEKLASELDVPIAIAKLLVLRNIYTADDAFNFFQPTTSQLLSPFLMQDMTKAVKRLLKALKSNEQIIVFGDYDVDGVTGAATLYLLLKKLGGRIGYFIPDRLKEGYGISKEAIDRLTELNASLVISVDCGITAVDEVSYAKDQYNIDFIICDHHKVAERIPEAEAVLNPKRPDCNYPFKDLAGCGVAYKFMQAVYSELNVDERKLEDVIDIVALGTAADIVPLVGENRILVSRGLKKMNYKPSIGLKALIQSAKLHGLIKTQTIVFNIAPRINACGRIGSALDSLRLLTAVNQKQAEELAQVLETENIKRRSIDEQTFIEAREIADSVVDEDQDKACVLYKENWHPGVIGIIAARMVDKYFKPTVMLALENGIAKGSARSIPGVNIYQALHACRDLLINFGGHEYAAGLSIEKENIKAFIKRFNENIEVNSSQDQFERRLNIDSSISLDYLNPRFVRLIRLAAPFGPHNMNPIFMAENVELADEVNVLKNRHIRFKVRQNGVLLDVIGFNMADKVELIKDHPKRLSMAFVVEENIWAGRKHIQLRLKDIA